MSKHAAELINAVPGIERCSYLELGLASGRTFSKVNAREKFSVDINPDWKPTFPMSTDQFFAICNRRIDVIFVDACHEIKSVARDVWHSLYWSNKFVFIHDLYPDNKNRVTPNWSGDGFKLLAEWIGLPKLHNFKVLDCDSGLTVIQSPARMYPYWNDKLTYPEFVKLAEEKLHRLSLVEMKKWIMSSQR